MSLSLFEQGLEFFKDDGNQLARFVREALPIENNRNELLLLLDRMGAAALVDTQKITMRSTPQRCINKQCSYVFADDSGSTNATCPKCACENSERYIDQTLPPRVSYKGTPSGITPDKQKPGYSRRPFFQEHRRKLTGKVTREIPEDVWTLVYNECMRHGYKKVDRAIVRDILKRCRRSEFYGCDIAITYQFNGVSPPTFTPQQCTILDDMFDDTEELFLECPAEIKQRESMIGYNYLLYKYCEMNSWDEFLPQIRLPQKPTVDKYDRIWKWICDHKAIEPLWSFYKTEV